MGEKGKIVRHRWTRLSLLAAGALMVPASMGVMAFSGEASAAVPAGSASCAGISLVISGTTATVHFTTVSYTHLTLPTNREV